MKLILGSGIVGLLAKFILGSDWKIIPFHKSRFFSFNPALDDNFIIRDSRLDPIIRDLGFNPSTLHLYNRYWSLGGELFKEWNKDLYKGWLYKIFGSEAPPQSDVYWDGKLKPFVYDIRVNQLYNSLMQKYMEEITEEAAKGLVTEIGDHFIKRGNVKTDFDMALSTIPLDKLYELMGRRTNLKARTLHYLHVESKDLNFEGANQLLVVDQAIDFYKVTNIAPNRYLFYCHRDLVNPGMYLMNFMNNFEILDGTSIDSVIPMGGIPKLDTEEKGIHCIGSSAQWDWCMDIGSCMIRIAKYSQFGDSYNKSQIIQH